MSESIKKVGCELHELSCPKDFGKVEVLPTNGVGGNESCKHKVLVLMSLNRLPFLAMR